MRHLPTSNKYSGLTVVLSNPSRHDRHSLLNGYAGVYFDQCLQPITHRAACDIRTSDTLSQGLIKDTKAILLLGERSMKEWTSPDTYAGYTLNEQRGCPLLHNFDKDILVIASYLPQDAMDAEDWESRKNPLLIGKQDEYQEEKEKDEISGTKRKGATKRSNWRFWLQKDIQKILRTFNNNIWTENRSRISTKDFHIYPAEQVVQKILKEVKNETLYLDIETDDDWNITTLGFCFGQQDVFVVPLLRYDYTPAYTNFVYILRGLAIAMRDNLVVCHNSMFDLLILAWRYRIPFGRRNYDTMIAQHRCFPEAEKSLGHCISLWLYEYYHKDEGIFSPRNTQQEQQLWEYNGKDVAGMRLVKLAQDSYASTQIGLEQSIAQGNSMIYPYLLNTLFGMYYSEEKRSAIMRENDKLMTQYLRIINHVTDGIDILPTSSKSCCKYFHDTLGYPIVGRTQTGAPSLDEKNILKLRLKQPDNPILDLVLAYRAKAKESGSLKFVPWKN